MSKLLSKLSTQVQDSTNSSPQTSTITNSNNSMVFNTHGTKIHYNKSIKIQQSTSSRLFASLKKEFTNSECIRASSTVYYPSQAKITKFNIRAFYFS
ncbi:hypothetical protein CsSME_00023925 [Camellia sinensis var. sinensis]